MPDEAAAAASRQLLSVRAQLFHAASVAGLAIATIDAQPVTDDYRSTHVPI
jgi:hypothetical protein